MERNTDIDQRINAGLGPISRAIKGVEDGFANFATRANEKLDDFTARLEDLESRASQPRRGSGETTETREHKTRFLAWLKKPHDQATKAALSEFEARATKGVNIADGAAGGYGVPEEISRDIERLELKLSPVRSLVKVTKCSSGDFKQLVTASVAGEAGWVGESDARNETATPQLRERAPSFGEIFAYPSITEWSLDDIQFDAKAWLTEEAALQFAMLEGAAIVSGDGNKKPLGLLHTAPVSTADDASPLRDAAALQYIASLSTSSPAVAEITADSLIDLCYATNSAYRANGSWAMNSKTAGLVAKMKDREGRYIWQQSLIAGMPNQLLGFPVSIWEQMDDVGTNKYPAMFGDFRRGYLLADRTQLRITVDSNITTPGKIKFYLRRREGGCVLANNAIKVLKTTIA